MKDTPPLHPQLLPSPPFLHHAPEEITAGKLPVADQSEGNEEMKVCFCWLSKGGSGGRRTAGRRPAESQGAERSVFTPSLPPHRSL